MLTTFLALVIIFGFFLWVIMWIKYYNKLDSRLGNTVWKWSFDYKVIGKRDISILDDEKFVLLRRQRNKAVTIMYLIFFLGFLVFMSFISHILLAIQS